MIVSGEAQWGISVADDQNLISNTVLEIMNLMNNNF
jgi:hypothetical protein